MVSFEGRSDRQRDRMSFASSGDSSRKHKRVCSCGRATGWWQGPGLRGVIQPFSDFLLPAYFKVECRDPVLRAQWGKSWANTSVDHFPQIIMRDAEALPELEASLPCCKSLRAYNPGWETFMTSGASLLLRAWANSTHLSLQKAYVDTVTWELDSQSSCRHCWKQQWLSSTRRKNSTNELTKETRHKKPRDFRKHLLGSGEETKRTQRVHHQAKVTLLWRFITGISLDWMKHEWKCMCKAPEKQHHQG